MQSVQEALIILGMKRVKASIMRGIKGGSARLPSAKQPMAHVI
jgi:hypothetical protein